jgi:hypothetical protein
MYGLTVDNREKGMVARVPPLPPPPMPPGQEDICESTVNPYDGPLWKSWLSESFSDRPIQRYRAREAEESDKGRNMATFDFGILCNVHLAAHLLRR